MLSRVNILFRLFGIDFRILFRSLSAVPWFISSYLKFRNKYKFNSNEKEFSFGNLYPCLLDRSDKSGIAKGHYFHQDLLVAQNIYEARPDKHVDIGSRVDGLVAHVASFREIEVIDIRDQQSNLKNIKFIKMDMMHNIDAKYIDYCDSISCLHALEHFGLGRYGDDICVEGYFKGVDNISKLLKRDGIFYLSVPIGPQRIEFNAHRVFSINYILKIVSDEFQLNSFAYIDDKGNLHADVKLDNEDTEQNFGCVYGCGVFELKKK